MLLVFNGSPYCGGTISCWHTHPDIVLILGLFEAVYLGALWAGRRASPENVVRGSQVAWFTLGVLILFLGAGTPIHDISEQYLFSVHMFQHTLFTLAAPPFLLLGTPDWLLRSLLQRRMTSRAMRLLTYPLVAFVIFNLITLVTHLPVAVDLTLRYHNLHLLAHVILVLSALLMWWPVLSPLPELPRLSYPLQMAYLFLQSLVPTVLASFITFANHVLYDFYANAPRIWGMSARTDQQIAGLIMKLMGGAILWLAIGIIFFKWYNREEGAASQPLRWEDVEVELDKMGLTRR